MESLENGTIEVRWPTVMFSARSEKSARGFPKEIRLVAICIQIFRVTTVNLGNGILSYLEQWNKIKQSGGGYASSKISHNHLLGRRAEGFDDIKKSESKQMHKEKSERYERYV